MADKNKIIYLWDDPPFRGVFDPELNPGIDPRTVKCADKNTQIRVKALDGSIFTTTPNYLTRRKGFSRSRIKHKSDNEYCIDDPFFVEWYRPFAVLNPGIDINTLRTSDQKTLIKYEENGEAFEITPYYIINCLHVNVSLGKPHNRARGNSKLRDWLETFSDLNPGIDPDKIKFSDNKTKLYYRPRDSIEICSITPKGLSQKEDWYAPQRNREVVLAKDVPGFLEWFELYKDLNPDVDIASLTAASNIRLYYFSRDGTILGVNVYSLCVRKDIFFRPQIRVPCSEVPGFTEWFETYRWLNPDIDLASLTTSTATVKLVYIFNGERKEVSPFFLCRRVDLLAQIKRTICGDPLFWTYCIEEDRRIVDTYVKKNGKIYLKMRCPEGHEYTQTPETFYYNANHGRDPCPICDRRMKVIEGVNDAASVDPEIKLFYSEDNDRPVHMVGAFNGHSDFKFKCPYCGHEFTKRMKNIAGKHPKCPKCKDKGLDVPQNTDYMPEGIPYLLVQDDPKSK